MLGALRLVNVNVGKTGFLQVFVAGSYMSLQTAHFNVSTLKY